MDEVVQYIACFLSKYNQINSIMLGGSRSKKNATKKSDYDFFLLINDDKFSLFKNDFCNILEQCSLIDIATFYSYVENWGYIYKAIGSYYEHTILIDISILPIMRVDEMSLRSTNIVLLDREGIARSAIENNKNNNYDTSYLERLRRLDYAKMFGFEYLRFNKSIKNSDYWLAVKALERMKIYYLHYKRIKENKFANNPHCPEKNFNLEFQNDLLQNVFWVSGDFYSLISSAEQVFHLFYDLIDEKDILDRFSLEI